MPAKLRTYRVRCPSDGDIHVGVDPTQSLRPMPFPTFLGKSTSSVVDTDIAGRSASDSLRRSEQVACRGIVGSKPCPLSDRAGGGTLPRSTPSQVTAVCPCGRTGVGVCPEQGR